MYSLKTIAEKCYFMVKKDKSLDLISFLLSLSHTSNWSNRNVHVQLGCLCPIYLLLLASFLEVQDRVFFIMTQLYVKWPYFHYIPCMALQRNKRHFVWKFDQIYSWQHECSFSFTVTERFTLSLLKLKIAWASMSPVIYIQAFKT